MGKQGTIKKDPTSSPLPTGSETIEDIKKGDCLKIACCDCSLTHNFIVKMTRGKTESGDRVSSSIFTDFPDYSTTSQWLNQ